MLDFVQITLRTFFSSFFFLLKSHNLFILMKFFFFSQILTTFHKNLDFFYYNVMFQFLYNFLFQNFTF